MHGDGHDDKPPDEWDEVTNSSAILPIRDPSLLGHRPSYLQQVEGPGAPRLLVLQKDLVVLGRSLESDIPLASTEISRRHLIIRAIPEGHACEDAGSRNGVFLNGVKIHSASLRDGDTLQIGNVVLVYRRR
jgi:pSer/pThr/pTyr-binding forkhead associated (FHA) protein